MALRVLRFRMSAAAMAQVTGLVGELIVNLTNNSVHVHDGITQGGHELARADLQNANVVTDATNGVMTPALLLELQTATTDIAALDGRLTTAESDIQDIFAELASTDPANFRGPAGLTLPCFDPTAPLGWVKLTVHNNKALRVVTGTPTSGGTHPFTTVHANRAVTVTVVAATAHSHGAGTLQATPVTAVRGPGGINTAASGVINVEGSTAAGGAHGHAASGTTDLRVQYVDLIQIQKEAA